MTRRSARRSGTIVNDDVPSITISDVTAAETNAGTTQFTFNVTISANPTAQVQVGRAETHGHAQKVVDSIEHIWWGSDAPGVRWGELIGRRPL